jgi:hypothetical protein
MKEEVVRGFDKKIIGFLRTQDNGDIIALTFPGRIPVGRYLAATDDTIELPSRIILTKGNTVVQLLFKPNIKR